MNIVIAQLTDDDLKNIQPPEIKVEPLDEPFTIRCKPCGYRLFPKMRIPRKEKKRRKALYEMRLKDITIDGKWLLFFDKKGNRLDIPTTGMSQKTLARIRQELNRISKGGGRKFVFKG